MKLNSLIFLLEGVTGRMMKGSTEKHLDSCAWALIKHHSI
jgi:hypothetical protein